MLNQHSSVQIGKYKIRYAFLRQLERDDQQGASPEVTISGMSLVSESSRLGYDLSDDKKQH